MEYTQLDISILLVILVFLLLTRNILWILFFLVNAILHPINLFFIHREETFSGIERICGISAILLSLSSPFLLPWSLFAVLNALVMPINIVSVIWFNREVLLQHHALLFFSLIFSLLTPFFLITLLLKSIICTPFYYLTIGVTNMFRPRQ